jgi:beta-glucosidase
MTFAVLSLVAAATCDGVFPCSLEGQPLYKLADQSVDDRVSDLLARMTVAEKVAQMLNPVEASFEFFAANFTNTSVGTIYSGLNGNTCGAGGPYACQNAIQALFLNSSRLGIPASFIGETLHSAGCSGGTIFPVPVLLGATFNVDLISRIGTSIARQARACGIDRGLSPVLQVDTDPRFGRFEESYGEDPFLVSTMGTAMTTAHQGNTLGPSAYINDTQVRFVPQV